MELKSILTVIRASDKDSALAGAIEFAKSTDGHLMVMVLEELPAPMVSAFDMVNADIWTEQTNEAKAQVRNRVQEIEQLLASEQLKGSVVGNVSETSTMASIVGRAARYNDITYLLADDQIDRHLHDAVITGALFESGTPIITSAQVQNAKFDVAKVVIAWNATPQSARAVHEAIPFLQQASEVTALLIDPVPSFAGHGQEPGMDLANYLAHHNIKPTIMRVPSEGHSPDQIIRRTVQDMGADLLVMGGYGHSRLRQRIIGGTTASMLTSPPCPVMMTH